MTGALPDGTGFRPSDRAADGVSPASAASIPSAETFAEKAADILAMVERLEALHAEASAGEWFPVHAKFAPSWTDDGFQFVEIEGQKFYAVGVGDPQGEWSVTAFQGDGPNGRANANFISAAKCAMPALLFAMRGMCEAAQAIETRSAETTGSVGEADESAVPQGMRPTTPGDGQ